MKLSGRIFTGMAVLALITAIAATVLTSALLYGSLSNEIRGQIKNETYALAELINSADNSVNINTAGENGTNRITLIASDGTVKYDSSSRFEDMENHLGRPEVQAALKNGVGEDTRTSATFGKKTYYYAVRLDSGDVLRVSTETASMFGTMVTAMPGILFSIIIFLALAMAIAGAVTRRIITPINTIDLDNPLSSEVYDELSPLLVRIDIQNTRMREQNRAITKSHYENEYITRHMNDGLVVIAPDGKLIQINEAAENIFGCKFIEKSNTAATYLSVCRLKPYRDAAEKALRGEVGDEVLELDGKSYRLSYSSVANNDFLGDEKSGENIYAVLIFIHDITEKEAAEKIRREFSANVSHELKTPLTSIIGCSEIIKEGIAKPEDRPRFLARINSEAKRLLALIDDIIRLSNLDEGGSQPDMTDVDLAETANSVSEALELKAQQNNITIDVDAKPAVIRGHEGLLYEMIYNLCDNAVRYNNPGGNVTVRTGTDDGGNAFVSVKDNGIGIPEDSVDRIFERFYRVDKSHSKETGGTGLGLSIVKHAAILSGGRISVKTALGVGTEIKVVF